MKTMQALLFTETKVDVAKHNGLDIAFFVL
jgi:hypothetical protein